MATKEVHHRSLAGFIGVNGGIPAAPVNTVAPVITGTAQVGQTLSGSLGTWTGRETPTRTRQWRRNGTAIPGATGATYACVLADLGAVITLRVTGTNWAGTATGTSAGTAAVIAA